MRELHLPLPEPGLIVGTRAALGFGLGLLLADRMSDGQRKVVGWSLLLVGVLTTFPLAADVLRHRLPATQGRSSRASRAVFQAAGVTP
jgi:hypothetical protein